MNSLQQQRMIEEYKKQYAREGCNCLCWGHCCLICWLVSGIIFAVIYYELESRIESDYETEYDCVDTSFNTYDVCCQEDFTMYPNVSCEDFQTICWFEFVVCIIQAVVAIIGIYALIRLNHYFLTIPMGWTIVSIGCIIYFVVKLDNTKLLAEMTGAILVLGILAYNFYTVEL